jgi:hypothetical protein
VPAWRRFERYAPNDLWQIDGTQVELADGSKACPLGDFEKRPGA